jgi:hypothetical protein
LATEMRPALAPIETVEGEAPTHRSRCFDIDAQAFERLLTDQAHFPGADGILLADEPTPCLEMIVEQHAHGARHVVVAGSGRLQPARRGWHEGLA